MHKSAFSHLPILCLALSFVVACGDRSIVYRPDIVQGNILDEEDVQLLETGMSKDEVQSIVGAPLADNVFRVDNNWYYYHSIHPGDGVPSSRLIVLHFSRERLTHISGDVAQGRDAPDAAEDQQRVVRVPDPPKVGIFGRLFGKTHEHDGPEELPGGGSDIPTVGDDDPAELPR